MKKLMRTLVRCAPDLVMVAGAVSITIGTGMIYIPAGFIVGGMLMIAGVALLAMSGGDET